MSLLNYGNTITTCESAVHMVSLYSMSVVQWCVWFTRLFSYSMPSKTSSLLYSTVTQKPWALDNSCRHSNGEYLQTTWEHGTVVAPFHVKRQQESKAHHSLFHNVHNGKTCLSLHTIKSVKFEHAELTQKPCFCYKGNKASGEKRKRDGRKKDFSVMSENGSMTHWYPE